MPERPKKRQPVARFESKPINWGEFENLMSLQCTQAEIAAWFNIHITTLENRVLERYGESLSVIWNKKKLFGKVRLRKAQFNIVERAGSGATAMAIWLDKKINPEENPDRPPPPGQRPESLASGPVHEKATFKEFCARAGYFEPFEKQIEMKDFVIGLKEVRLLLGARGYGKTDYGTIMGVAYDIYCAWFDGLDMSEFTNLIVTKSKARNAAIINEIANALEKNGVPFGKATESVLRVEGLIGQDHSVEAITIKSSLRGRHPKRIVMDDPVTDEDVSESMRKTVKRRYDEAYKLSKNICVIGQPAHAFDLYAELRGIVKKMEVPHGMIPELDADLEAMRLAGIDENSIQMSYHLVIPESGSSIFANIKYIDDFPKADGSTCVAFIDPSDGGDFTAVTVLRGYMDGVAVTGKAWKKAWYHCLDDLLPWFLSLGVKKICFETNKHGLQPLEQLRRLLGPHGIAVDGVHSDSNKHAMIVSAGSYAHMIHLSKRSDKTYNDQVTKYEYGSKYDDSPDSLARCLQWVGLLRGKK